MTTRVFISYSYQASYQRAKALSEVLERNSVPVYFDSIDLKDQNTYPANRAQALLDSKVMVVFATHGYFEQWDCLRELRTALTPFLYTYQKGEQSEEELEKILRHVVIAWPDDGLPPSELSILPIQLHDICWPKSNTAEVLAELVLNHLDAVSSTLRETLEATCGGSATQSDILQLSAIPDYDPALIEKVKSYYPSTSPLLEKAFLGRSNEIWKIDFALFLFGNHQSLRLPILNAVLSGCPGVGKTQLVLEYFFRFAPGRFPGGRFWIDLGKRKSQIEKQFYDILLLLDEDSGYPKNHPERDIDIAQSLSDILSQIPADQPVLFVLDNLSSLSEDGFAEFTTNYQAVLEHVSVLAINENRVDLKKYKCVPISLHALGLQKGIELLSQGLKEETITESNRQFVAQWVNSIPLALVLLNSALRKGSITQEQIIAYMDSQPSIEFEGMYQYLKGKVHEKGSDELLRTLLLCYQALSEPAQCIARIIAHLAPSTLPRALMDVLCQSHEHPHLLTQELQSSGFVLKVLDSDSNIELYGKMHELVATFLDKLAPPLSDVEISSVCSGFVELFNPQACKKPENWPTLNACVPHAEVFFTAIAQQDLTEETAITAAEFASQLGLLYRTQGRNEEVYEIDDRAYTFVLEKLGKLHEQTLVCMGNLALTLQIQGELGKAQQLQEKELEIRNQLSTCTSEGDFTSLGTLTTMNNLALTLKAQGNLEKAVQLQKEVFDARREALGPENPSTINAMSNLASTLTLMGNHEDAALLQQQILDSRKKLLGEDHLNTLSAMKTLASTYYSSGDFDAAYSIYDQCFKKLKKNMGSEHPNTLACQNNLALVLAAKGDFDGSRKLQEQALKIRIRTMGEDHPNTLASFSSLAPILHAQGDLEAEKKLQEEELKIRMRVHGDEHPSTLTSMNNLASVLHAQGNLAEAKDIQQKQLEISKKVLGEEHPHTLTSLNNLASTLYQQGDIKRAITLQEQVLSVQKRIFGLENSDTLISMNNYATMMKAQGDLESARKLQEEVLEVRKKLLGPEHPDTLTSMNNLASTLKTRGDIKRAYELEDQVFSIRKDAFGLEHPDTLTSMNNLASILKAQGDIKKAGTIQEQVYQIRKKVLGPEHPDTLTSANNLASMLKRIGSLSRAFLIEEEVLETRKRVLGIEHPGTTISAWNFVTTLIKLQGKNAAIPTIDSNLSWLLKKDLRSLTASQQKIREMVRKLTAEVDGP